MPRLALVRSLDRRLHLFQLGVQAGFADYRRMFTWRTWLFGWLLRLLAQVAFFASLGRLLGAPESRDYIALGNAALLGPLGALGVVASCAAERRAGTLPFLLLGRAAPLPVLAARGAYWVCDAAVTAALATALLPLVTGFSLPTGALAAVLALEVLGTVSCYALALTLTPLSMRFPESRGYLTSGVLVLLMLFGGVNTAPASGPGAVVAALLPMTHALTAIRALAAGGPLPPAQVLGELLVCAGWTAAAALLVPWGLRRAARAGALT
ncbi:ABC transporter permease [Streptomyces sp. NPDC049577]|uniref:ABC transporter permease n=1 Tax=Streptomyces sp. NPDC049577 TaxID=3155153 RepID=UPI00341876EB